MQSPPSPNQPPYQPSYSYYPPPPVPAPQPQQPPQRSQKGFAVPVVVIVLAVLAGALVLCCAVGAIGSVLFPSHAQVIHTANVTTQPTMTPSAPTLGGTIADFQQRYGAATDSSGLMYAATIAGQRVLITLTFDAPSASQDGQQRVAILAVQVPGDALGVETWSQEAADQIAQTFLPADALFQHIVTTGTVHDHVYHSATLAQTFTADQFTNDVGNAQAPAGTLNYSCHPWPPSASGLGQCLVSIGSYAAS